MRYRVDKIPYHAGSLVMVSVLSHAINMAEFNLHVMASDNG
jgi:hypothetical protein